MRIPVNFVANLLDVTSNPSKDGTKVYNNAVLYIPACGSAGELPITDDLAKTVVPGKTYEFSAVYNTQYRFLTVESAKEGKK